MLAWLTFSHKTRKFCLNSLVNLCLSQSAAWMNAPKRREQNLIVCCSKSEAEVTNNERWHSRYCTAEANYRQTQSIAQPVCDSRATCYDCQPVSGVLIRRGAL